MFGQVTEYDLTFTVKVEIKIGAASTLIDSYERQVEILGRTCKARGTSYAWQTAEKVIYLRQKVWE